MATKKVKNPNAAEFIKKLKASGGHLMCKIKTADGKTMIYYRKYGSYPTDIKTKVFNCYRESVLRYTCP